MSNSYLDNENHKYNALLEMSDIDETTMTDAGVLAGDLYPIVDAILSPGEPSPLGRTEDGDLAYPVFRDRETITWKRSQIAQMAYAVAKAHGITKPVKRPFELNSPELLLNALIKEALPDSFYAKSNHCELARKRDLENLLTGNLEALSYLWEEPGS